MKQILKLQGPALPKALSELTHANQFLKIFSTLALCISTFLILLCLVMNGRQPVVLAFAPSGKLLEKVEPPKPESEIREAISAYLDLRYKWSPKDVQQKLSHVEVFIAPKSIKAFREAILSVVKFSTEKQVSQNIFPDSVEINLEKKSAKITGDRISSIQGIRAAGNLYLTLEFDFGDRSISNPWGIYITKEKEVSE